MSAARLLNDTERFAESVHIPSGDGALAGELCCNLRRPRLACALMNPHPFMGGQMDNHVIRELSGRLTDADAVTLRFDYRGVGESGGERVNVAAAMLAFWETGVAPNDPAMVEDARAAVRWIHDAVCRPIVLLGYSFGAWTAMQAIDEHVKAVILISPTLRQHDYSPLTDCPLPKLVIHGENDFATPRAVTEQWIASLPSAQSLCIPGGEHFFRRKESQVADACLAFIRSLPNSEEALP